MSRSTTITSHEAHGHTISIEKVEPHAGSDKIADIVKDVAFGAKYEVQIDGRTTNTYATEDGARKEYEKRTED